MTLIRNLQFLGEFFTNSRFDPPPVFEFFGGSRAMFLPEMNFLAFPFRIQHFQNKSLIRPCIDVMIGFASLGFTW